MTDKREGVATADREVQDLLKQQKKYSFKTSGVETDIPLNKRVGTETGFLRILFTADQKELEEKQIETERIQI